VLGRHRSVERHAERDRESHDFDELFLDVHDRLYRALYFVTGNSHEAEADAGRVPQLWDRWDSIETIEDPTAYLFRAARNGFRMRARRARVTARSLLVMQPPDDEFEEIDLKEGVRRELIRLPTRQRAALVLTEIFASRILGIGRASIRVLASRGRAALRRAVHV
jgi:DNA-directed RNA polymerase specialized sigma24 family protein